MKKNELLERLKEGNFDLSETITTPQFKDIEVARYYFKNLVEQDGVLNTIIKSNYNNYNSNLVRFAEIYNVILDNIKSYSADLKTNNYENLKDLALYLKDEDREWLYKLCNTIIKYDNVDGENEEKTILFDFYEYIVNNNINGENKELLYALCLSRTDFYDNMKHVYIKPITKLIARKQGLMNIFNLTSWNIFDMVELEDFVESLSVSEKINIFLNTNKIIKITMDDFINNTDLIFSKMDKNKKTFLFLKEIKLSNIYLFNVVETIWDKYYNDENIEMLTYILNNSSRYSIKLDNLHNLKLDVNNTEFNYNLCNNIFNLVMSKNSNYDIETLLIMGARLLLNQVDINYVDKLIVNYPINFIWNNFVNTIGREKDINILTFLKNITLLELSTIQLYGIGKIYINYILQTPLKLNQFLLTRIDGHVFLKEDEWLDYSNKLTEIGYSQDEIKFIKTNFVTVE